MTVKRPEQGEIIFEDDVVIVRADTLMKWTDSLITIAELRVALAKREGPKWKES